MTVIDQSERDETDNESFVSVLVDRAASAAAVHAAVSALTVPRGVNRITVDDGAATEIFDCRIVIYLTGDFDCGDGTSIARDYAAALTIILGTGAHCLADLLLTNLLLADPDPAHTPISGGGP